jgi:hypothetical protein
MPLAPAVAGSWSIVSSPNASTTQTNILSGVTCVSASDCWAVGYYVNGSAGQTVIERWDGSSWAIVSSPNTLPTQDNILNGVTCVSASECWAVGYYNNGSAAQSLIERWNGTSWAIVGSPDILATQNNYLSGVTCVSASNCWAVGYYLNASVVYQSLIEHWDGSSWAIVTSANTLPTQSNFLYGVTCVSASNCWAVGYYFITGVAYQSLIEQWDGSSWAVVSSPNTLPTQDNVLNGVTCVSESDCWTVGYYYSNGVASNGTLIERWNGTSWSIVSSPSNSASAKNVLNGVTCLSASNCWAVGSYYTGGGDQTLIEHWDGTLWTIVPSPNTSDRQTNVLSGVTCASTSDCWAVGNHYNGGPFQTLTEHYTVSPPIPTSVVSRKTHGTAGTFDITLPLAGTRGVECRSPGQTGTNGVDYKVVFTFANNISNCGTAGTTGGSVVSGPNPNQCTENLTGIPNAQYTTVTLNGVTDAVGNSGNVVGPQMGVLVGDVNASGVVTSGDTNLCKAQALQPVTATNFRNDINVSGSITTGDVNIIKQNALEQLPSPP